MTIDEYTDIVFNFDDDLSEEDIAKKLADLGVSEEEQTSLANEFLNLLAPEKRVNLDSIEASRYTTAIDRIEQKYGLRIRDSK